MSLTLAVPSAAIAVALAVDLPTEKPARRSGGDDTQVCTLSEDKTKKAVAAFAAIAQTLSGEPRCANCHGGVDPFAADAGAKHAGGKFTRLTKGGQPDQTSTFMPCQGCHTVAGGTWRTAPPELSFVGKDPKTLCKQQRQQFDDPGRFLGHMDNDNGGTQFIATAFAGTRGLNDTAKKLLREAGVPYHAEPPSISRASYEKQSNDWIDALDGEFPGGPSCGCAALHYAIHVEETDHIGNVQQDNSGHFDGKLAGNVPITFQDNGAFTGTASLPRGVTGQILGKGGECTISTPANEPMIFTISGHVDKGKPGTMTVTIAFTTGNLPATVPCVVNGQAITLQSGLIPLMSLYNPAPLTNLTLPAAVGQSVNATMPILDKGSVKLVISIAQLT